MNRGHRCGDVGVVLRGQPVEGVLQAQREHDLVHQRVAEPRHLLERGAGIPRAVGRSGAATVGGRPDADHRVGGGVTTSRESVLGQLEGDAVHVVAGQGVRPHLGEVPAVEQVEDAEVEEERVVGLTRVGLAAAGHRVGRLGDQWRIVGDRCRTDERGRGDRVVEQERLGPGAVGDGQVVGLVHVQVGIVDRRDRTGVVQELARVTGDRRERPRVGEIGHGVAVVVDLDVVASVLGPRVEVRAAVGLLEREPVGDQGNGVGGVGADERIDVGVVGAGIARDQWGFTMARGRRGGGSGQGHDTGHQRQRSANADSALRSLSG